MIIIKPCVCFVFQEEGAVVQEDAGDTSLAAAADQQEVDDPEEVEIDDERNAFFQFKFREPSTETLQHQETAEEEVDRYLTACKVRSPGQGVRHCFAKRPDGTREYPRLAELFLKYNTALPSSATVERMFSQAGLSFSHLRTMLNDCTLEKELLLKVNTKYW